MKRLLALLPAAAVGLLAGWLISRLLVPSSAATRNTAPAAQTTGAPSSSAPDATARDAWAAMLVARALEPLTQNKISLPTDHGAASPGLSAARRGLEIELARFSLSAAGINSTSLGIPLRDGDAGFAETCARLAKTEPGRALSEVEQMATLFSNRLGSDTIDSARSLIFREWLKKDPAAALAAATDSKQVQSAIQRSHRLALLMDEWTRLDPAAAAAAFPGLPRCGAEFERQQLAESIVRGWYEKDPAAARQWASHNAEPALRDALLTLTDELTATSPGAKTAVLLGAPQRDAHKLATTFGEWLIAEPAQAVEKLASIPVTDKFWEQDAANVAQWWVLQNRDGTNPENYLETISSIPAGPRREALLKGLADYGASNDIPFGLRMVSEMAEGRPRDEAVSGLTALWMRKDPVKTSEWLTSLPPDSASRLAGVACFAEGLAPDDPERAAQWASTLPDTFWQKAGVMKTVMEKWRVKDAAAAEAWEQERR